MSSNGPTDWDWCSPLLSGNNGSGKLLAEALARKGFVRLRFDKLGSGARVRQDIAKFQGKVSMKTQVDELAETVDAILSEEDISDRRLFALTNSEGAIHAVNYQFQATSNKFTGLVLTRAPDRAIGDVSRTQIYNQAKSHKTRNR